MMMDWLHSVVLLLVLLAVSGLPQEGTYEGIQDGTQGPLVKKQELKANRDNLKVSESSLQPQQIHISLGDSSRDMTVMWATEGYDSSVVEYHTGDRTQLQRAEGQTMKLDDTNDAGLKHLHHVTLRNLGPKTKYFYQVRGQSDDTLSESYSFTVPPVHDGNTHMFMVYGDLGTQTNNIQFLLQEALNEKYEAIFHIGDIAYNLSSKNGEIGDKFLRQIEKVSARIPYMTVPGDHETDHNYVHYRHRFSMPNLPWPMPSNKLWYSIDVGPIHFIMYSTEVFFYDDENTEAMLNWLKEDLDKANSERSARPWIIAMGHKPMYCSVDDINADCSRSNPVVRRELEDLFYAEGVDLIISAHQHLYQRTWPVYKKRATQNNYRHPSAPVHLIIGTLGLHYMVDKANNEGGQWLAFSMDEPGRESFGRLKVYNATHLSWEVRECLNNRVIDTMWINQPYHRPFTQPRVFFPNPLGEMGQEWMDDQTESYGLESFLGLRGKHYGDDYQTKLTVLFCVFIICLLGLIARKKVLSFVRIICLRKEPCNKIKAGLSPGGANV
ncbi:ACP7-like protein [Mya arenaria]|uniref:Purple acid phosphatase n=1 Tax=Mya arenaria TaxID=6604 RepID=A0ABY7FXM7_MYAAR|nr:acid phosphatase type 7-like [Mya arenaria]XP_052781244.1 acid phosphatase type 7-like [Mya arenaria]XP_052781246.1 acid phosphatase type 7-like [Mya arenaria]WAR25576.1 ACP7-like protein [Mya arenaria]